MKMNRDHRILTVKLNSDISGCFYKSSAITKLLFLICLCLVYSHVFGNDTLKITNLPFNSLKDDAYPFILNSDSIIFTSNRDGLESVYLGICCEKENKAKKIFGGNHNYSCVGISPDKKSFLVYSDETGNGDLMIASIGEKNIITISGIPEAPINTDEYSENSGWISNSGDTIIFSSNRPGGIGGFDFWWSTKNGKSWNDPVLFENVNTPEDEMGISVYDSIMYFGSKGFGSLGGFDIFYMLKKKSTWDDRKPLNAVNSQFNELFFGTEGYFCSNRNGDYNILKVDTIKNSEIYDMQAAKSDKSKDTIRNTSHLDQTDNNNLFRPDTNIISGTSDTLSKVVDVRPKDTSNTDILKIYSKTVISEKPKTENKIEMAEYFYIQIIALSPCNVKTISEIIDDVCYENSENFRYKLRKEYDRNLNKYLINRKFLSLDEAIKFMNEVKEYYKIQDIFIVGYKDNKRYAIFFDLKEVYYY